MSAPLLSQNGLVGWCQVTGTTGAITNSALVASCTRVSAGLYTVALSEQIDAAEAAVSPSLRGTVSGQITAIMPSDGTVTVSTFNADGSAATDKDFALLVQRVKAPS